jgi:hypothetical protein
MPRIPAITTAAKIRISRDLPATLKANDDRGVDSRFRQTLPDDKSGLGCWRRLASAIWFRTIAPPGEFR